MKKYQSGRNAGDIFGIDWENAKVVETQVTFFNWSRKCKSVRNGGDIFQLDWKSAKMVEMQVAIYDLMKKCKNGKNASGNYGDTPTLRVWVLLLFCIILKIIPIKRVWTTLSKEDQNIPRLFYFNSF